MLAHVMDAKLCDHTNTTTNVMLWRSINAEKNRVRESLEDIVLPAPDSCLSAMLDLFSNTYGPSDLPNLFSPNKALGFAIIISNMLSFASNQVAHSLMHHCAALAAVTLVESLKNPIHKDEVLAALQQLHQALQQGQVPAGTRWTTPLKNFLAANIQQHLGSGPGANGAPSAGPDRAGLQHLADAAVGETETETESEGGGRKDSEYSTVAPKGYLTMLAKYA